MKLTHLYLSIFLGLQGKPIVSNCKVFRSQDKKRIYIYMLNGEGVNRYEVTWIIKNRRYYGRVIDYVPE